MYHYCFALTAALSVPVSASAQTYMSSNTVGSEERRTTIGITIPFGKGGKPSERTPRVELAVDHRQRDANGLEIRDALVKNPVRLGLTLSTQPKMMLNGQEMMEFDDRKNISTGVWIGAGVITVAALALAIAISSQGPSDCLPGECDNN